MRKQEADNAEEEIRAYQIKDLENDSIYQGRHKLSYISLQMELMEVLSRKDGHIQTIGDTPFCEASRKVRDQQLPPTWTTTTVITEKTRDTPAGTSTVTTTRTTKTKSATLTAT